MTTITREHLELAAKAAGKKLLRGRLVSADLPDELNLYAYPFWQPQIDPADTWQLAADCKMRVDFKLQRVAAYSEKDADWPVVRTFGDGTGRTAAEAVTLAASEIGRAMG